MRILVSGASGLVGSALVRRWTAGPEPLHQVARLVRRRQPSAPSEVPWDPEAGQLDPKALEGFDAIVHLAGENVGQGRWTREKMARIRNSRVRGTALLCAQAARLSNPPTTLISASAVGFYGDRNAAILDESAGPGSGFLADVCREWESATQPAAAAGIRVVLMRIGVVLAREGGALGPMLRLFRLGLGGRIGSGNQYTSWISLEDLVAAVEFLLTHGSLCGPVNVTSPEPVTNRQFTRALAHAVRRPAILHVPSFALRLALGAMADEMLLASIRAVPKKLVDAGFSFRHAQLDQALLAAVAR
ncbi:MAG: TIGR01777 family oxidoreductase [Thermoguttaceae bacterium]|jgi:uncharacterized protein (TIGR01777 family)|nr:TIGR01777 family oxidoreductase [Thermoguttaceae bacterium]